MAGKLVYIKFPDQYEPLILSVSDDDTISALKDRIHKAKGYAPKSIQLSITDSALGEWILEIEQIISRCKIAHAAVIHFAVTDSAQIAAGAGQEGDGDEPTNAVNKNARPRRTLHPTHSNGIEPVSTRARNDDGTGSDINHEGLVSDSVAPTLDGTIIVDFLKALLAETTRGITANLTANIDSNFQIVSSEFQRVDQTAKEALKLAEKDNLGEQTVRYRGQIRVCLTTFGHLILAGPLERSHGRSKCRCKYRKIYKLRSMQTAFPRMGTLWDQPDRAH